MLTQTKEWSYLSPYDFSENKILSVIICLNLKSPINYTNFQEAAELLMMDGLNKDCLYEEFQMIKYSLDIVCTSSDDKNMGAIEKWNKVTEG